MPGEGKSEKSLIADRAEGRRGCCAVTEQKDLLHNRRAAFWLWGVPLAAFLLGFFLSPSWRTVVWTLSLTTAGVGCAINASRCGRVHCRFTGPFFLLGAAVVLSHGIGVLPLGPYGWLEIGAFILMGACLLTFVPERLWGMYATREREGED